MITYDTGGLQFLFNIIKVHGSVFPKALCSSLPSAAISFAFVILLDPEYFDDPPFRHFAPAEENIMNNNAVWGGFSFLIGFLVVFRTSQAYNRFWEGCTQMHKMGAEWFDACSSLVAFCKHSAVDTELILQFQNTLIRLFSMLHAAALGQIEDTDAQDYSMVVAFNLELIDPESIDDESMEEIRACHEKVELIFQWIQQLIVENIKPGVLSVPPPILSRSFQEIANGMVHFHEAMKIANVPFPFPYAQTCDALLVMHWFMVPFVVAQWATKPWWAAVFSFIQVFTFWCLNLIALELENPFGTDPNDIDGGQMQVEMNERLRLLLRSSTKRTPRLLTTRGSQESLVIKAIAETEDYQRCSSRPSKLSAKGSTSFAVVWKHIDDRIALRETESEAVQFSSAARGTMIAEPSDFQIARDAYDERNKDRGNPPVTSVPATARQEQPIQYQIHNGRHQFVIMIYFLNNFILRMGWTVEIVNMNYPGLSTLPGCIASITTGKPLKPGVKISSKKLSLNYGHQNLNFASMSNKIIVKRLAYVLDKKQSLGNSISTGKLIYSDGVKDANGLELLLHQIKSFKCSSVLVIGSKKLYTHLIALSNRKIDVFKIDPLRSLKTYNKSISDGFHKTNIYDYFFFTKLKKMKFHCFNLVYALTNKYFSTGSSTSYYKYHPFEVSSVKYMSNTHKKILAVSHSSTPEEVLISSIAAFIRVIKVDLIHKTLTYFSPLCEDILGRLLII